MAGKRLLSTPKIVRDHQHKATIWGLIGELPVAKGGRLVGEVNGEKPRRENQRDSAPRCHLAALIFEERVVRRGPPARVHARRPRLAVHPRTHVRFFYVLADQGLDGSRNALKPRL